MIKPKCYKCKNELKEFGAILLSDPVGEVDLMEVLKFHLCKKCYKDVLSFIEGGNKELTYICDENRHLICVPYSIENLHRMAEELEIKKCWFHKDHYDIPKRRIEKISSKCIIVSSKEIVKIMHA